MVTEVVRDGEMDRLLTVCLSSAIDPPLLLAPAAPLIGLMITWIGFLLSSSSEESESE